MVTDWLTLLQRIQTKPEEAVRRGNLAVVMLLLEHKAESNLLDVALEAAFRIDTADKVEEYFAPNLEDDQL
jgi:hypothetical protein